MLLTSSKLRITPDPWLKVSPITSSRPSSSAPTALPEFAVWPPGSGESTLLPISHCCTKPSCVPEERYHAEHTYALVDSASHARMPFRCARKSCRLSSSHFGNAGGGAGGITGGGGDGGTGGGGGGVGGVEGGTAGGEGGGGAKGGGGKGGRDGGHEGGEHGGRAGGVGEGGGGGGAVGGGCGGGGDG
eukprot:701536-Prymnesium_polylepis.3